MIDVLQIAEVGDHEFASQLRRREWAGHYEIKGRQTLYCSRHGRVIGKTICDNSELYAVKALA